MWPQAPQQTWRQSFGTRRSVSQHRHLTRKFSTRRRLSYPKCTRPVVDRGVDFGPAAVASGLVPVQLVVYAGVTIPAQDLALSPWYDRVQRYKFDSRALNSNVDAPVRKRDELGWGRGADLGVGRDFFFLQRFRRSSNDDLHFQNIMISSLYTGKR